MAGKLFSIRYALITGTIFLLVVTAALLVRQANTAEGATALSLSASSYSPIQQAPSHYQDRRQILRVWMHGDSFYPDVLRARPGIVLIRAENETQSDVSLVVERVIPGQSARQEVTRVNALRKDKRSHQELSLGAGEYIYYELSQPEIQGRLIVEPQ